MGNVCPEECLLLSYSYQLGGLTAFSVADVQDILFRGLVFELVLAGSDEADHLAGAFGRSNIAGGDGNDRIVGSYNSDWFSGGAGNDIISGGAGKDLLEGGAGNDKLNGGNDDDYVFGGDGADQITGGYGADYLDGGDGDDLISGGSSDDIVLGGLGNDRIYGEAGDDQLDGGGGRDVLDGGIGNDYAYGGDDKDTILLRLGDDTADGGAGNDRIYGHAGNDILFGGDGADLLDGGTGDDVLGGGTGNDWLYGGLDNDVLEGGEGHDRLYGHTGDDRLIGGDGDDYMAGHGGADIFTAGAGSDRVFGGNGSDLAIFSGAMADYTISAKAYEATVSVNTDVDSLYQIEFLQFDDGFYNIAAQFGLKVDPIAQVDAVSVAENETVQFTVIDNDIDDGTFSFLSFTDVSHGVLSHFGNGQFEYAGDLNYFGDDVFTYDIVDLDGNIATASVYLTVEAVNSAPDASPDILYLDQSETVVSGNVLINDSDLEGDAILVLAANGATASGSTYQIQSDGTIDFMASGSFSGSEVIVYTLEDVHGAQTQGQVTITNNPAYAPALDPPRELWVGAGEQYSSLREVAKVSEEGDTIYVRAGTYIDDYATFNHSVSIIGVGGQAHFKWLGDNTIQGGHLIPNGKGILNFGENADYLYVENLTLEGAVVGDRNGAGIRYHGKDLTVVNTQFIDNQNGILGISNDLGSTVSISNSYFDGNGFIDGLAHSIYIKDAGTVTVENTQIVNTVAGHHVKSLAGATIIRDSVLDDGTGTSSFAVDVSKGGDLLIENTTINQTNSGSAPPIINYSIERGGDIGTVLIKDNTFNNEITAAILVRNNTSATATVQDNIINNSADGTLRLHDGLSAFYGNVMDGVLVADFDADDLATTYSEGDDIVIGTGAEDFYALGGGDDWVASIQGNDAILAGTGNDTVYGGHGFDNIYGQDGDDLLIGAGSDDLLIGGAGNDELYGGIGADMILGGTGDDIFIGGIGGDIINGGDGTDIAVYRDVFADFIFTSAAGRHFFNGGQDMADWGRDALINVEYAQFLDGVLNLETGAWQADTWIVDSTTFEGPPDPTAIVPNSVPADLAALGLTVLEGTSADKEIITGTAADEVLGGGGGTADVLVGGGGDDIYFANGVTVRVIEAAGEGTDTLYVYREWGRLDDNVENLVLRGDIHSNGYGNALNNVLTGNDGRNRLEGGDGDDILNGGAHNDVLVGGEGSDRFQFTGPNPGADWIVGFDLANDIVEVQQSLIGTSTEQDILNAATDGLYGAEIAIGGFRLTFGKIDAADLTEDHFVLI